MQETSEYSGNGYSPQVCSIAEKIDDLICDGTFGPGYRLVEKDLMERFSAGRVPIREALRILAGDGILEIISGRGARVRSYDPDRVKGMFQAFTALLCAAIQSLAERPLTQDECDTLRSARDSIKDSLNQGTYLNLIEQLTEYHEMVTIMSGNKYLIELTRKIHMRHYRYQMLAKYQNSIINNLPNIYNELTDLIISREWMKARDLLIEQNFKLNSEKP